MKKVYKLLVHDNTIILEEKNSANPPKRLLIDLDKLQLDTKQLYDVVFFDVVEHIEVELERDQSISCVPTERYKTTLHICDMIEQIITQACARVNEVFSEAAY